jgi:hypothetical protein
MDARFFSAFSLGKAKGSAGRSRLEEDGYHVDPNLYAGLKSESDHSLAMSCSVPFANAFRMPMRPGSPD